MTTVREMMKILADKRIREEEESKLKAEAEADNSKKRIRESESESHQEKRMTLKRSVTDICLDLEEEWQTWSDSMKEKKLIEAACEVIRNGDWLEFLETKFNDDIHYNGDMTLVVQELLKVYEAEYGQTALWKAMTIDIKEDGDDIEFEPIFGDPVYNVNDYMAYVLMDAGEYTIDPKEESNPEWSIWKPDVFASFQATTQNNEIMKRVAWHVMNQWYYKLD
jgi:hypothetical protein